MLHCPKYQNIRNSYNTLFQSIRTDDDLVREILDPNSKQNKFDNFENKQTIYVMHSSREFSVWVRWGYHYRWEERGSFRC